MSALLPSSSDDSCIKDRVASRQAPSSLWRHNHHFQVRAICNRLPHRRLSRADLVGRLRACHEHGSTGGMVGAAGGQARFRSRPWPHRIRRRRRRSGRSARRVYLARTRRLRHHERCAATAPSGVAEHKPDGDGGNPLTDGARVGAHTHADGRADFCASASADSGAESCAAIANGRADLFASASANSGAD